MKQSDYRSRLAQSRQKSVMKLIQALPVMPTAIHVPARIMQLYRNPNPLPLDAFADVLIADAALSAKVLELANSAWFAPPKPVTRVSDALKRIGLSNLMPLLFGLSLAAVFNKADLSPEERHAMWQTSLLKGMISREWARYRGLDLQEEAFLCGVLQDIALPAMIAADRSASPELMGLIDLGHAERADREAMLFGADHAGFGARVCNKLKLPELYIAAAATHHSREGPILPEEYRGLAPGLKLAAAVPHAMTRLDDHGANRLADCFKQITDGASAAEFAEFIKQVGESGKALMSVLVPSNKAKAGMKNFLQEVAEQIAESMAAAIGASSSTIDHLQTSQADLEQKILLALRLASEQRAIRKSA